MEQNALRQQLISEFSVKALEMVIGLWELDNRKRKGGVEQTLKSLSLPL